MKKPIIVIVILLLMTQWLVSEQIDNIVLLDTSISMLPYYSGTIDYLIEDIIKEQLLVGDTFHLLSFNDFPDYEISRTIKGETELSDILNRILLLQPVGKYTDLISAFSYLYEYVDKLKLNSIKNIVILTDGIHDPPPESTYPISNENKNDIIKISDNMRRQGWHISLIQFPISEKVIIDGFNDSFNDATLEDEVGTAVSESSISGDQSSQENPDAIILSSDNNLFPLIADALDEQIIPFKGENTNIIHETGSPEIIYPGHLGTVGYSFKATFSVINHSSDPVLLNLTGVFSNNSNLLYKPVKLKLDPKDEKPMVIIINLPEGIEKGNYNTSIELNFDDNFRAYPRKGSLTYFLDPEMSGFNKKSNTRLILYIIIGTVLLLALAYILINALRSLRFPVHTMDGYVKKESIQYESAGSSKIRMISKDNQKNRSPDQMFIEMIVKNQNRQIGHRNIHLLENNHPRSVGGAGSEYFLIFIIATGKRIAEIILENGQISFLPKENAFFPDLEGRKFEDCLGKTIRVVNGNGLETTIVFTKWISPVERLNRIMHLTDESGLPKFKY